MPNRNPPRLHFKEGFVYLVKGPARRILGNHPVDLAKEDQPRYKIGATINPKLRFGSLKQRMGTIECLHLIRTDDMESLERRLHNLFADKRIRDFSAVEEFFLGQSDIDYICSL